MKAIPAIIAESLADTMANIIGSTLEMTHTFYDSYHDENNHKYLTKREFKLHTYYMGGVLRVSFHIVETTPDKRTERLNISDVQTITVQSTMESSEFVVTAEGITMVFPIEVPEEEQQDP